MMQAGNPGEFDTLHWLGIMEAQNGRFDRACELLEKALAANPRSAEAHTNYANVLKALRRFDDALASYDKALAINPSFPEVLSNRGTLLHELGRYDEALASYDRALALRPDYADALNNRGNTLLDLERHAEALASYERALRIKPDYVEALNNRGVVLQRVGRYQEALASIDQALALRPTYAEGLSNRANALCSLRRFDDALASADAALAIAPHHVEALDNRGNALQYLKRYPEALASYEQALALRADYAEAWNNRAAALREVARYEEALADCERALAIRPDHANAFATRGEILRRLSRHDEAATAFARALEIDPLLAEVKGALVHSRMNACDWRDYQAETTELVVDVRNGRSSCAPFALLAISDSPQDQLACAHTWVEHKAPPTAHPIWRGERYVHDRIRVAYLSADFHEHATMHLMAGLLERHDRSRFEITALSFGPDDPLDRMQARVKSAIERFIDVSTMSDQAAARVLRDLEIDIAVDLKGFTTECRPGILAWRPCPVQVSYLGYPGTMAASYIDYLLADAHVIPYAHRSFYSEQVVYLPHTYQVNDDKRPIAKRAIARGDESLPGDAFVFCCFNNAYKITPQLFDCWMRLLRKVDDSVLWLLQSNAVAARNLQREAAARGVAPERLVFARFASPEDHLARHALADLFLDTLPYNAHTTASDALWAGLPVVTCSGNTFAGRVAGSLLHAGGLSQLVTSTLDEYEALALKLTMRPAFLAEVRETLARHRARYPLFDTDLFRRHIEAAYVRMWERQQRGDAPAGFVVDG